MICTHKLKLWPADTQWEVREGASLQDVLFTHGVEFPCGGRGRCKGCRVKVLSGALRVSPEESALLTGAELSQGWRMACRHTMTGDLTLELAQWEMPVLADASAGFKASGKHAGHGDSVQHGFLAPGGPEPGDLPNLFVAPKAPVGGEFVSTMATLSNETQGGRIPLLDADGSALIVHANPDDMKTQPVGNAGDRVACAAIPPAPSAP